MGTGEKCTWLMTWIQEHGSQQHVMRTFMRRFSLMPYFSATSMRPLMIAQGLQQVTAMQHIGMLPRPALSMAAPQMQGPVQ